MTELHPLAGIYAAALTPLQADFSIAAQPVAPFLCLLAGQGCHGALLFGTTGEGPSFSAREREIALRAAQEVRQVYPDFRLLAGTGTPSLEESVTLTRRAFELGADGVVVLPPYYFRAASEEGLFRWYDLLIRQAVPQGKFLLGYHIPGQSGVPLGFELLARLKDAHPEKFAGIKDSSGDPAHAIELGRRFGAALLVLTGNDKLALHALEHHAGGAITAMANLYARYLRQVWDIYNQDGDAIEAQESLNARRKILDRYAPFPPILKALLPRFHPLERWPVKPPLLEVSDALTDQAWLELSALDKA
ncbi:MAG: dihydrodipicolinate synthase family protein [Anaerolineales bacterium]